MGPEELCRDEEFLSQGTPGEVQARDSCQHPMEWWVAHGVCVGGEMWLLGFRKRPCGPKQSTLQWDRDHGNQTSLLWVVSHL